MKIKGKLIVSVLALSGVIGGLAWATPIFDLAAPILATGSTSAGLFTYGIAPGGDFAAAVKTTGPTSIIFQDVAYSPGGHTGWHSHPGILGLSLAAGTLDWYNSECKPVTYKAGDAWTEGSQLHYFKVTSTVNAHLLVAYFVPKGAATRIDEPAPACAAALGLD